MFGEGYPGLSDWLSRYMHPTATATPAPAPTPVTGGDPNVDSYISSVLAASTAAAHQPTVTTDSAGNVTSHPYTGPASYISTDGRTFSDPESYRTYQTQYDTQLHNTRLTAAMAKARQDAQNAVTGRGLSYSDYQGPIEARLAAEQALIPQYDTNPDTYFDPNAASNVLGGIQATNRNQYVNTVNSTFNPTYDNTRLPDNFLDSTIQGILSPQEQAAHDAAKRGLARGQFNQVGYNAAESNIGTQDAGARATLGSAAHDVLNSYRTRLDSARGDAFSAASNYNLGDHFNIGDYTGKADSVVNDAQQYAPGSLINQVGKTPLFDVTGFLNAGGSAQGPQNLGNTDVAAALADQRRQNATRGLGTQGSF